VIVVEAIAGAGVQRLQRDADEPATAGRRRGAGGGARSLLRHSTQAPRARAMSTDLASVR
jgi:hypothetical protein